MGGWEEVKWAYLFLGYGCPGERDTLSGSGEKEEKKVVPEKKKKKKEMMFGEKWENEYVEKEERIYRWEGN